MEVSFLTLRHEKCEIAVFALGNVIHISLSSAEVTLGRRGLISF